MPTIEGPKVSLTWENFLLAAAVVLALLAVVVLIAKGADAWTGVYQAPPSMGFFPDQGKSAGSGGKGVENRNPA